MTCRFCGSDLPDGAMFCGDCGRAAESAEAAAEFDLGPADVVPPPGGSRDTAVIDDPPDDDPPDDAPASGSAARTVPDPFPWGAASQPTTDRESKRVVGAPPPGMRFVLQFSTGDSVIVSGAGLIGRNPAAEPGEFFDQLVTIFDAGKSVSKTHLEFGQEGGRFWVCDRYSTNGSQVRQPDLPPKRCEAGRRYFVARGSRVDIGDQFFVVS